MFEPVRTMTATIAAEMGEVAQGSLHYNTLSWDCDSSCHHLRNQLPGRTHYSGCRGARREGGKL